MPGDVSCVAHVVRLSSRAQRSASAEDIWEALFPTIMMGDDRAVTGTWVAGERTRVG